MIGKHQLDNQQVLKNFSIIVICEFKKLFFFSFEYDTSHFLNTVMQRWNLVCGPAEYLPKLAQTIFFCGNLFGVLICGWAADHFGRKPCIIISSMASVIGCIIASKAPNIIIWMVARFIGIMF